MSTTKMLVSDYQTAAQSFLPKRSPLDHLINAALGLCGEAAELNDALGLPLQAPQDELEASGAAILLEAGDLLWYVAALSYALAELDAINLVRATTSPLEGWAADIAGRPLSAAAPTAIQDLEVDAAAAAASAQLVEARLVLSIQAGRIAELVKKHIHHRKPFSSIRAELDYSAKSIICALVVILRDVRELTAARNMSLETAARANLDKLRARWPDGFKP